LEARVKRIVISLTPSEKALLRKLAEYEGGLTFTATFRHLLTHAVRRRGLSHSDGDLGEPEDVAIPSNARQVSKKLIQR